MAWYWNNRNDPKALTRLIGDPGTDLDAVHVSGRRPVHYASLLGHHRQLRQLCRGGCDVDARTSFGLTALLHAARAGAWRCARELLRAGADPSAADAQGQTMLHHAAGSGDAAAVEECMAALGKAYVLCFFFHYLFI